jgi:CheY-like chemotaxis protein
MSQQAVILLVEDNESDATLVCRALGKGNVVHPVQVVRSGEEAVEYLEGADRYANRDEYPVPELVLLDLNLPGMNGFQVLEWIRDRPEFQPLRVVVLTSCEDQGEATHAYQSGANSFLVKPANFDEFVHVTDAIQGYWFWTSKTPQVGRPARRKNR